MASGPSVYARARSFLRSGRDGNSGAIALNLPDPWLVVSEPASTGALGKVVVGPGGVFLVRSAPSVVGSNSPRLVEASRAAGLVANQLTARIGRPVAVHPIVAVAGDVQPTQQPAEVTVVASRLLDKWFLRHPAVLAAGEVGRLTRAVRLFADGA